MKLISVSPSPTPPFWESQVLLCGCVLNTVPCQREMQSHHAFEPDGSLLREAVSSDPKSRSYVGWQRIFEFPLSVRGILDMGSRLPLIRLSGWFGGSVTQRVSWACPGDPEWILTMIFFFYHQVSFLISRKQGSEKTWLTHSHTVSYWVNQYSWKGSQVMLYERDSTWASSCLKLSMAPHCFSKHR